jgi:hypothetical protein
LLETTRAYALEKLAEAEESAAIERRHAIFFRDLFDRAYGDWYTLPDVDWCNAYLPERDNLRNALDWAFGPHGEPSIGIEIAGTSHHVWWQLSLIAEARQRMEGMAAHVDESTSPKAAGRFWLAFGRSWLNIAPIRSSEAHARATALLRQADLPIDVAYTLVSYAQTLPGEPDFEAPAEQALTESWPLVERTRLPRLLGMYFAARGYWLVASNPALAREHFESALSHWRAAGAEGPLLNALGNLADLTWTTGDLQRAVASMREALALVRGSSLSNRLILGVILSNLAGALIEQGELDDGLAAMREGIPLICESGTFFRFGDHFSLRLAKAGLAHPAARLLGYTDGEHERFKADRQVNEARAHASLHSILSTAMAPGDLAQQIAEGAKLTEDEAVQLALTP